MHEKGVTQFALSSVDRSGGTSSESTIHFDIESPKRLFYVSVERKINELIAPASAHDHPWSENDRQLHDRRLVDFNCFETMRYILDLPVATDPLGLALVTQYSMQTAVAKHYESYAVFADALSRVARQPVLLLPNNVLFPHHVGLLISFDNRGNGRVFHKPNVGTDNEFMIISLKDFYEHYGHNPIEFRIPTQFA
jgi:hypothetical protein